MALLLVQPLLAGGLLPGLRAQLGRRVHGWIGGLLVASVVVHVGGLWITSPPDVIDALLFASPTPFSVWGVIAMWAIFAAALLATLRRRLACEPDCLAPRAHRSRSGDRRRNGRPRPADRGNDGNHVQDCTVSFGCRRDREGCDRSEGLDKAITIKAPGIFALMP